MDAVLVDTDVVYYFKRDTPQRPLPQPPPADGRPLGSDRGTR